MELFHSLCFKGLHTHSANIAHGRGSFVDLSIRFNAQHEKQTPYSQNPTSKKKQTGKLAWRQTHLTNKPPPTPTHTRSKPTLRRSQPHSTNQSNPLRFTAQIMKMGREKTYKERRISDSNPNTCMIMYVLRRPLPTAEGARQRSNYTQQVVHAASVKVPAQKQKCLASQKKGKEKAIKLHEQGASKQGAEEEEAAEDAVTRS